MAEDRLWELATDGRFREAAGFGDPPRAGVVTAVLPSGQVQVDMDDPDGGAVVAWPLNGFVYGVGDVVYVAFAANSPDGGVVLGAKAPLPTLDALVYSHDHTDKVARDGSTPLTADWDIGDGRKLIADILRARDAAGISLTDDAGNGLHIADGGDASFIAKVLIGLSLGTFSDNRITVGSATGYPGITFGKDATHRGWMLYDVANNVIGIGGNYGSGAVTTLTLVNDLLGIKVANPQGTIHAHNGVGGLLFVTKTGIDGTAQTILPNGTGDVTKSLAFLIAISDGSIGGAAMNFLFPGGYHDFGVGGLTVRLACAADGSLTVKRQSGTGTATIALVGVWL